MRIVLAVCALTAATMAVIGWPSFAAAWERYRSERAIRRALNYDDPAWISAALERSGPKRAVPVLAKALKNRDASVRRRATFVLGKIGYRIGGVAEDVVPPLIEALKDEDFRIRADAAEALGKLGTAAMPAVPQLLKSLEDENGGVRVYAAVALQKIDPSTAAQVQLK